MLDGCREEGGNTYDGKDLEGVDGEEVQAQPRLRLRGEQREGCQPSGEERPRGCHCLGTRGAHPYRRA
eukprot:5645513-Prorocentrum_lima.AAC.1